MANEIQFKHDFTGRTLKAVLGNQAGQYWNTNTGAWESLTLANVANYAVALTESPAGSYRYQASVPAGITAATVLTVWIYEKATALATADLPNDIGSGTIEWTGTAVASTADLILDWPDGVETGLTLRQALRGITAAELGKISGGETNTVVIRDVADTIDRLTATVDQYGNRTAVTRDLT